MTKEQVYEKLETVIDPELGVDVVNLGLIYGVKIDNNDIIITMTLTTPGCPLHDMMKSGVHSAVESLPNVGAIQVNIVWEPQWTPEMMSGKIRDQFT
ncbi:metal-sulfur cluster assembly factor [Desertibacillus haloalkaliphilus]|nr:metal-sulfur cluster assembly factor [Desertibacillus haloalkaliphilus]